MYEDEQLDDDILETTTEDGEAVKLRIIDYFFYNGEEYSILTDVTNGEDEDAEEVDCFVMNVETATDENGEEYDDFLPIEDAALEEKLMEVASIRLNEEDDEDEE